LYSFQGIVPNARVELLALLFHICEVVGSKNKCPECFNGFPQCQKVLGQYVRIEKTIYFLNFCFISFSHLTMLNCINSIHDGTLLHSKFNTQLLIAVHNSSRILTQVQLLPVL
jgi:hypothetical protein